MMQREKTHRKKIILPIGNAKSEIQVMQDSSMNFFEKGGSAPLLEKIHTLKQQRRNSYYGL